MSVALVSWSPKNKTRPEKRGPAKKFKPLKKTTLFDKLEKAYSTFNVCYAFFLEPQ